MQRLCLFKVNRIVLVLCHVYLLTEHIQKPGWKF